MKLPMRGSRTAPKATRRGSARWTGRPAKKFALEEQLSLLRLLALPANNPARSTNSCVGPGQLRPCGVPSTNSMDPARGAIPLD
jgi:hypothetical protein